MTTITRYSPIRSLRREFDRLFEDLVPATDEAAESALWAPAVDFSETDDAFVARVDLPGMQREDIHVDLQDRRLSISGERRQMHEEKGENFHRMERAYGAFFRSITLPAGIDEAAITAGFEGGVLTVRVPKSEARKPRRIEVAQNH